MDNPLDMCAKCKRLAVVSEIVRIAPGDEHLKTYCTHCGVVYEIETITQENVSSLAREFPELFPEMHLGGDDE